MQTKDYRSQFFLNFTQLQAKLGHRSRSTIYRDIEAGRLPKPVKLGSRLYWPEEQIDAVLAELSE
ncbi:MAG: AlpA family phage regulatory protein [Pseudomonadota bacterium]